MAAFRVYGIGYFCCRYPFVSVLASRYHSLSSPLLPCTRRASVLASPAVVPSPLPLALPLQSASILALFIIPFFRSRSPPHHAHHVHVSHTFVSIAFYRRYLYHPASSFASSSFLCLAPSYPILPGCILGSLTRSPCTLMLLRATVFSLFLFPSRFRLPVSGLVPKLSILSRLSILPLWRRFQHSFAFNASCGLFTLHFIVQALLRHVRVVANAWASFAASVTGRSSPGHLFHSPPT